MSLPHQFDPVVFNFYFQVYDFIAQLSNEQGFTEMAIAQVNRGQHVTRVRRASIAKKSQFRTVLEQYGQMRLEDFLSAISVLLQL